MKMFRSIGWILGLALVGEIFFTSCTTTYTITSDYNKETDFSKYYTYNYLPGIDTLQVPGSSRFRRYTEEYLQLLGYTKSDEPDLYISVISQVQQKTGTNSATNGGYNGYYGRDSYATTYVYSTTTIVIDLVDANKHQLIWQGAANGEFDQYSISNKKLHYLIDSIFGQFPYSAGSNTPRPFVYKKYYKKPEPK